jgi:macrolide-specific efflux system membrane fusion protein
MTATTTVTTGAAFNVLQVPAQAVTTRGSGSFVNVLTTKNGKDVITRTPVVLGLIGDSADQILSGINSGAKVVLPSAKTSVGANGFPAAAGLGVAIPGGGFGGGGGRGGGG